MKQTILSNFLVLAALALLASCSGQAPTSTMKISTSFAVGSSAFPSGMIAYGEGPNGQRFSVSSSDGAPASVTIPDGTWKIYVIGYDDPSGEPFFGVANCGAATFNLTSTTTDLHVQIDPTKCLSDAEFTTDVALAPTLVRNCGAFYDYDSTTKTFTPHAGGDPDFCSTQLADFIDLSLQYPVFRLMAIDVIGGVAKAGMVSECTDGEDATGAALEIPNAKIPLAVKYYRTFEDCENPYNTRFLKYDFPNGLIAGNRVAFDSMVHDDGAGTSYVVVPGNMTRRGYSPFMHMLPKLTCGSGDCMAEVELPITSTNNIDLYQEVPWMNYGGGDDHDKMLIPNLFTQAVADGAQCSSVSSPLVTLLKSNPMFSLDECTIEGGNVNASFSRNPFFCRNSGEMYGTRKLVESGGFIFIGKLISTDFVVEVWTPAGKHVQTITLTGSPTEILSITTDVNKHLYVLALSTSPDRIVYKFNYASGAYSSSPSTTWNSGTSTHLSGISNIEWAGSLFAWSVGNDVKVSTSPANSAIATYTYSSGPWSITKLLWRLGKLYALAVDTTNELSEILRIPVTTSSPYIGSVYEMFMAQTTAELPMVLNSFHISKMESTGQDVLILLPNTPLADGYVDFYDVTDVTTLLSPYQTITSGSFAIDLIAYGDRVTYSKTLSSINNAQAYSFTFDDTGAFGAGQGMASYSGLCEVEYDLSIDFPTYLSVNFAVRSSDVQNHREFFNDLFQYVGSSAYYPVSMRTYYDRLNDDHGNGNFRALGEVGEIREMLSPAGVGGVLGYFYQNKSCADVASLGNGKTHQLTLREPMSSESKTFNVSINSITENMEDFVCDSACSGTDKYDLLVSLASVNSPEVEKMRLKLKCETKQGSLEGYEYESQKKSDRKMILWSFNVDDKARYERYSREMDLNSSNVRTYTSASVTTLRRAVSTNNFNFRQLSLDHEGSTYATSTQVRGNVKEIHLDGSGNIMRKEIYMDKIQISKVDPTNTTDTQGGYTLKDIAGEDDFDSTTFGTSSDRCVNNASSPASPDASNYSCTLPAGVFNMTTWARGTSNLDPGLSSTSGSATTGKMYFNLAYTLELLISNPAPGASDSLGIFEIAQ